MTVFLLPGESTRKEAAVLFPDARKVFTTQIRRHVDEPGASLLIGLLVGDTEGLPKKVVDDFRASGLGHIVAVSGYNVTKLVGVVMWVAAVCGLRKKMASVVAVAGVVGFVGVAGFSPSLVRAAVMAAVSTVAMLCGRRVTAWRVTAYTAALMLLVSPRMIRDDLGFSLSFLAVIGLALFKDFFEERLTFVTEVFNLRGMISETLAATAMVMPFSLAVFGSASVLGIFANIVVLPMIPLLMLLGLVVFVLSWIIPFGSAFVGSVVGIPLTMIISVAAWFARFPVLNVKLSAFSTVVVYSMLLVFATWLRDRTLLSRFAASLHSLCVRVFSSRFSSRS